MIRIAIAAAAAAGLVGCGGAGNIGPISPSAAGAPYAGHVVMPDLTTRRGEFPPTPAGIHLNLVFNYRVKDLQSEVGVVDVVWGSRSPDPKKVYNQSYTTFERDDPYGPLHSLAWWKQHHPDWIEYRCDRARRVRVRRTERSVRHRESRSARLPAPKRRRPGARRRLWRHRFR